MNKRYSALIITIALLITIVIVECFTKDEDKIDVLPVNIVKNYEYVDENKNVSINIFEINSKRKGAKSINDEIRNLFLIDANKVINNINDYEGNYKIVSEYNYYGNFLSIKIYGTDSNIQNTSGNIYSVIYDVKNDMEYDLSGITNFYKLDYESLVNTAKDYAYNKNKYIHIDIPYVYINRDGNLELIMRSLIQVDKYSFWDNIEIYEEKLKKDKKEIVEQNK